MHGHRLYASGERADSDPQVERPILREGVAVGRLAIGINPDFFRAIAAQCSSA